MLRKIITKITNILNVLRLAYSRLHVHWIRNVLVPRSYFTKMSTLKMSFKISSSSLSSFLQSLRRPWTPASLDPRSRWNPRICLTRAAAAAAADRASSSSSPHLPREILWGPGRPGNPTRLQSGIGLHRSRVWTLGRGLYVQLNTTPDIRIAEASRKLLVTIGKIRHRVNVFS